MDNQEIHMYISDEENLHSPSNASIKGALSRELSPKSPNLLLNTHELLASAIKDAMKSETENDNEADGQVNSSAKKSGTKDHISRSYVKVLQASPKSESSSGEENNNDPIKKLIDEAKVAERNFNRNKDLLGGNTNGSIEPKSKTTDHRLHIELNTEPGSELFDTRDGASGKNGGPVRLSKMSEEDAASMFESRKKELLNSLLKKGVNKRTPKNQSSSKLPPSDKQDFVVFKNSKNLASPHANHFSSAKKPDEIENAGKPITSARRDNSKPQSSEPPTSLQKTPKNRAFTTPKNNKFIPTIPSAKSIETPQAVKDNGLKGDDPQHRISVDLRKSAGKSHNRLIEKRSSIPHIETSGGPKKDRAPSEEKKISISVQNSQPQSPSNPAKFFKTFDSKSKKNNDILHDINNLDHEIERLAHETEVYGSVGEVDANRTVDSPRATPSVSNFSQINKTFDHTKKKRRNLSDVSDQETSFKEQLNLSYAVLNQRKFSNVHDALYEKAIAQQKALKDIQERSRAHREKKELRNCTFSPNISRSASQQKGDIIAKTKVWQEERERKLLELEREKLNRELNQCTFMPNAEQKKERPAKFKAEELYNKQVQWKKHIEIDNVLKGEERYAALRTNTSVEKSRLMTSGSNNQSAFIEPVVIVRKNNSPTVQTTNIITLTHNISRTDSRSKLEVQNTGPRNAIPYDAHVLKPSTKSVNSRQMEIPTRTKTSASQHEEHAIGNLQSQIMESYALLDSLQQFITIKKESGDKNFDKKTQKPEKENSFIKMSDPISYQSSPKSKFGDMKHSSLKTISPRTNNDIKTSEGYDTKTIGENAHKLVLRNNRYVIDDNSERPSATFNREAGAGHSREDSYSKRRENMKSTKAGNKINVGTDNKITPTPGSSGLVSPQSKNLENKYFDLLNQVNRVTKQITRVSTENEHLQKQIFSMHRNDNNMHSLYT